MSLTPEELARQIKEARAKQDQTEGLQPPKIGEQNAASGAAMRAGADLTAGILVGGFIGYWADRWLHTKPLFMIVLLIMGFVAGFLNIYREQTGRTIAKRLAKDNETTGTEE